MQYSKLNSVNYDQFLDVPSSKNKISFVILRGTKLFLSLLCKVGAKE